MADESTPEGPQQNYQAVGASYDARVQSGQLHRQHEDPLLDRARQFTQQLFNNEIYKPAELREIRFVELGSGVGFNTRDLLANDVYLSDTSRPFHFTAVDLSEESLREYATEVPKVRGNTTVETVRATIGDGVKQIKGPIDNVMSTGVYQITPEELRLSLSTLIPLLTKGGAYIFQYMPPQSATETTGSPYAKKITTEKDEYDSYRYPQTYLLELLDALKGQLGVKYDVKFVHGPVVSMRNPNNPEQIMPPHSSEFCVIHRK